MTKPEVELPKGLSGTIIALCFVPFFVVLWCSEKTPSPSPITASTDQLRAQVVEQNVIELFSTVKEERIGLFNTGITSKTAKITDLAFSPDGSFLVSSKDNGALYVWAIDNQVHGTKKEVYFYDLKSSPAPIVSIGFQPDTSTVFAVSHDGTISAWDLIGGEAIKFKQGWNKEPNQIRFYHELDLSLDSAVKRQFSYTLLEWTAACIALITGVLAFIHYYSVRDVSTPIIGVALFFSGLIDAFNVLSADHVINSVEDTARFLPFTWAISRAFNVTILLAGASLMLYRSPKPQAKPQTYKGELRLIGLVALGFAFISYSIVHLCSVIPELPQSIYPEGMLAKRPWDIPPMILLLLAGTVIFPKFYQKHPSLFSHGIFLSVLPHLATQLHVVFWSTEVFDGHFFAAYTLKVLAYSIPLLGLMLDYVRVYDSEAEFQETQQKLSIARSVQQNLLPLKAPDFPQIDLAGKSLSSDAVGGDYFDYVPMAEGKIGIVIADVSGHDLGASLFMAQTRAYLRALASSQSNLSDVLSELNKCLITDARTHRFVTLFMAQIDPKTYEMNYIAAGHQALLFNAEGNVETLGPTGPPLGVMPDELNCETKSTTFDPGCMLIELTDGILEAKCEAGTMFGNENVIKLLETTKAKSSTEIVDLLLDKALDFSEQPVPIDDMTVVVLKRANN